MHYFDRAEIIKSKKQKFLGKRIKIQTNRDNLFFLECNVKNASLIDKIILELTPKYIFHFGAQPYIIPSWEDPVETIETNVIGTINIFESIKRHKIDSRAILAGTAAEFGTTASILDAH